MFWSNGFAQPVGLMRFKKCKLTIGFVYIWPKYELKQSETTQANIYKVAYRPPVQLSSCGISFTFI